MTPNVKRFIELQNQINNQIDTQGQADIQLANELDQLGKQLTGTEVSLLYSHYEGDDMEDMSYEDVEWMIS